MPSVAIFPAAASTNAHSVDQLLLFLVVVCGSVGLLVAFLLIYFSIKYRRRPGQVAPPPETHSSHKLEWSWTIAPAFVFVVMFIWGAHVYIDAYHAPDDSTVIYGIGKQWMWKFQHPEGQREIDALHVPVGGSVRLLLTSEDVIHSFFVPAFRIHMDVLPQRFTSLWFQASKPGEYHLFCSQYCGTGHASMIGTVVALEPADYRRWLQSSAEGSLALQGRKVFLKYRCISCHSANENARAPVLEGLYNQPVPLRDGRTVIADENYIRESILNPAAKVVAGYDPIMPTFQGVISAEDLMAVIEFIRTLKPNETPPRVESFPPPVNPPDGDPQKLPFGAVPDTDNSKSDNTNAGNSKSNNIEHPR
ncbi:MAG TPA: cytochrome c oxidase subunit II [Pirellulales bacterium]|jgi:cytochrome c oxidase subunit 2|nr:cytochrome c oxidase subunit II [Pirellulales bacterium]